MRRWGAPELPCILAVVDVDKRSQLILVAVRPQGQVMSRHICNSRLGRIISSSLHPATSTHLYSLSVSHPPTTFSLWLSLKSNSRVGAMVPVQRRRLDLLPWRNVAVPLLVALLLCVCVCRFVGAWSNRAAKTLFRGADRLVSSPFPSHIHHAMLCMTRPFYEPAFARLPQHMHNPSSKTPKSYHRGGGHVLPVVRGEARRGTDGGVEGTNGRSGARGIARQSQRAAQGRRDNHVTRRPAVGRRISRGAEEWAEGVGASG